MSNLLNIINKHKLPLLNSTVTEMQKDYKEIGKYIANFRTLRKEELSKCLKNIFLYKANYKTQSMINLDEEQKEIVNSSAYTHMRIIAGAGSGKSTTILYRVKYLLENITTPDTILILTFNVSAAENLKERLKHIFGFDIKINVCTIDSFCAKIYYEYAYILKKKFTNISVNEFPTYAYEILKICGNIICSKYKFVFFDEFQDISDIQFAVLKIFADNGSLLTVIGDDNQNIYQWRGSNNMFIIDFDKMFKNTTTKQITTNYRSSNLIVDLANASIKFNKNRVEKNMKSNSRSNITPTLNLFIDKVSELKFIVDEIDNLVKNKQYSYDDFAILSNSCYYLKLFEEYLERINKTRKYKIPYVALINEKNNENNKILLKKNHLSIATIYIAKGLEWKGVFIVGISDGKFPCLMNNNSLNIEEDRRLFYVGITRAKTNLYMVANTTEFPLCRFIGEIFDGHLKLVNNIGNPLYNEKKNLFESTISDTIKENYGVTETIKILKPCDYSYFRQNNLIPDSQINTIKLYNEELHFNKKIKEFNFESDFGEFCDRVISRYIMKQSKQKIYDPSCHKVLSVINLNKEEIEVCNKYNLNTLIKIYGKFEAFNNIKNASREELLILRNIYKKIPMNSRGELVRENTYPLPFLEKLSKCNQRYCDKTLDNSLTINDIYHVSLCGKFCDNRRRLLYKDIYDIFMEDFEPINQRIINYSESVKEDDNICKLCVSKMYKIKDNYITLSGELDYVNLTNNTLIDFKCSEDDFKTEWLLQLLLYYSLLDKTKYEIKKLAIFNLLKGCVYEIEITNDYDCKGLLNYIEKIIARDISGSRNWSNIEDFDHFDIKLLMESSNEESYSEDDKMVDKIVVKCGKNPTPTNYIILDTETTGNNVNDSDIIQLAYQIYDNNLVLIKEVNELVIPERNMITKDAFNVHKINFDLLVKKGKKFSEVFKQFIVDMKDVKHVIGHNVSFDLNMIKNNLQKYNFELIDPFYKKNIIDTKELGKLVCKLKNKLGRVKPPSLGELYEYLFDKSVVNSHDALADVKACADCYFKIIKIIPNLKPKINLIDKINEIAAHNMQLSNKIKLTDSLYNDVIVKWHKIEN
jgi:DNA polymerase III epsilon subunit-like protein